MRTTVVTSYRASERGAGTRSWCGSIFDVPFALPTLVSFSLLFLLGSGNLRSQELFQLVRLDINTSYADEFAPCNGADGELYFCSDRKLSYTKTISDDRDNNLSRLYLRRDNKIQPAALQNFGGVTGPLTRASSGDLLYTAGYHSKGRSQVLGLFFMTPGAESSRAFQNNNPEWSLSQPSFSTNGDTLWFTSDQPGGFGGSDVYYSIRRGGSWEQPVNAGSLVNSEHMEIFPSMSPAGELTFASNRNGQFDIYQVNSALKVALALPAPVNSEYNEISLSWNDVKSGYLTSDRQGTLDIYHFIYNVPMCAQYAAVQRPELCYTFSEVSTFAEQGLPLRYEWAIMGRKYSGDQASHCFPAPGMYEVELNVIDSLTGDIYFNEATYEHVIEVPQQVSLKMNSDGSIVQDPLYTNLGDVTAGSFYYSFVDSWPEPAEKFSASDKKTPFNILITVQGRSIAGDTVMCFQQELRETDPRNEPLLVASVNPVNTINPSTFYPAEEPKELIYRVELMRSRTNISSDGHEFHKLPPGYQAEEWYLPFDSVYSYTIGSSKDPFALYNEYKIARTSGFLDTEIRGYEPSRLISIRDLDSLHNLNNTVFRASNIYFASGSYAIQPSARSIVDELATYLVRRPDVVIEVSAHTDSQGSDDYNQNLSIQRAASIMDYLAKKGIDTARLVSRGHGEKRPVADNMTADGRALNRRIEFRLVQNTNDDQTD